MPLEVGPFVGVSSNEARIWFEAVPYMDYTVEIKSPGKPAKKQKVRTEADGSAMAVFTGLPPNTSFNYSIATADGDKIDAVPDAAFATFPPPGDDADLNFAFFSCHRPFAHETTWVWQKGKWRSMPGTGTGRASRSRALQGRKSRGLSPRSIPARYRGGAGERGFKIPLLSRVDEKVTPSSLKMWAELDELLKNPAAGQEIRFSLALGDQIYTDELWAGTKSTGGERYYNMSAAALLYEYNQVYYKYLHIPQVQSVASHCPLFMMWDDHEIRDGWGSRGDEGGEAEQKMFLAASQAYTKYQLSHNPHADPQKGYYAFQYGKIGFVMLDLRRYRSLRAQTILGVEQKDWLEKWLKKEGRQCRVVFIACSVPVVHVTHALSMMANKAEMKFVGVSDDLADQWSHANFTKEMRGFAELLFDLSNHDGVRFILLGGDVHVGTFAVLRSHRRSDEYHPVIYQCTSSPISNRPSANVGRFLGKLAQDVHMGRNLPFSGRLLKVFTKRNFAVIEVRRHPKSGDYGVVFEMHCEGNPPERFATLW